MILFGLLLSGIAFLFFIGYIIYSFHNQTAISGWASLIATVVFLVGSI